METIDMKTSCIQCGINTGMTTCNGCQQKYSMNHFTQHRQELANKLENLDRKHDRFRHNFDRKFVEHPLLLRIQQWEQDAIDKIQIIAKTARTQLQDLLDRTKTDIEKSIKNLSEEFQSTRQLDNYTDIDIKKWTEQLRMLRKTFESPPTIRITENESLVIPIILVHNQQEQEQEQQYELSDFSHEHIENVSLTIQKSITPSETFDYIIGRALASEECRVITCNKWFVSHPIVYGSRLYSSGIHYIDYRIEKIGNACIFFGMTSSSGNIQETDTNDEYLNGWWDLTRSMVNGETQTGDDQKFITTGDEVTLTLDCDYPQIQLQHHQTRRQVQLMIDIRNCPLPWKTVIKLGSKDDSIRILE